MTSESDVKEALPKSLCMSCMKTYGSLVMRQADIAFKSSDLNERHYAFKSRRSRLTGGMAQKAPLEPARAASMLIGRGVLHPPLPISNAFFYFG